MTVFMPNMKTGSAPEVVGPERRRRWSQQDKLQMVRESYEPGNAVSMVARRHEVNPNQLFQWRKLHQAGALSAVSAGEAVVPLLRSLRKRFRRSRPCSECLARGPWKTRS